MNNLFDLSDEVMSAVITNLIKHQQQMTKNSKAENPFKADSSTTAKKYAYIAKEFYNAYIEAGFTQGEAFELLKCVLTAGKN